MPESEPSPLGRKLERHLNKPPSEIQREMNGPVLVEVKNLTRFYGTLQAVKDVSFTIRKGEVLTVSEKGKKQVQFLAANESAKSKETPNWIEVDRDQFKTMIKAIPVRDDITMPIEEQMVVELYSK